MKFIIKPRGLGKTTDIINLALARENAIILVATKRDKDFVRMKIDNTVSHRDNSIKVCTVDELKNKHFPPNTTVFVDELERVFLTLINNSNLNIDVATLTL